MNWRMLRSALVIALTALIVSACCSSKQVTSEVRGRTAEMRDSARVEQVMVAVHDTIVETTTITVRENEVGDTLRLSRVTERDRVRDRVALKDVEVKVTEKTDTVYVERRDSVEVKNHSPTKVGGGSVFVSELQWVFWVVLGLIALGIVLKHPAL